MEYLVAPFLLHKDTGTLVIDVAVENGLMIRHSTLCYTNKIS